MSKIQDQLKGLYPEENLSDEEIQSMSDDLSRFFALCLKIVQTSPQTVQGNKQKIVQNANYMG